jgi:hypothetical protein
VDAIVERDPSAGASNNASVIGSAGKRHDRCLCDFVTDADLSQRQGVLQSISAATTGLLAVKAAVAARCICEATSTP